MGIFLEFTDSQLWPISRFDALWETVITTERMPDFDSYVEYKVNEMKG